MEQEERGMKGGWVTRGAPHYRGVCFLPWCPPAPWLLHIPKGRGPGARAAGETGTWKDTELSTACPHDLPPARPECGLRHKRPKGEPASEAVLWPIEVRCLWSSSVREASRSWNRGSSFPPESLKHLDDGHLQIEKGHCHQDGKGRPRDRPLVPDKLRRSSLLLFSFFSWAQNTCH